MMSARQEEVLLRAAAELGLIEPEVRVPTPKTALRVVRAPELLSLRVGVLRAGSRFAGASAIGVRRR